jgi:hypothetical protein
MPSGQIQSTDDVNICTFDVVGIEYLRITIPEPPEPPFPKVFDGLGAPAK